MKSFLSRVLGGVIAIGAILAVIAFVYYMRLPHILSEDLSKKLKVDVSIDKIDISLSSIEVKEVSISNPPNNHLPKALSIESTRFEAPITHYLKDKIEIEKISLDQIYLGLEFNSARSPNGNWSVIMSNLPSPSETEQEKELSIKELILTNIDVEIYYKDTNTRRKLPPIDKITLNNINSKKGFPTDQIMRSILGEMLKSVFIQENLKNMIEGVLQEPQGTIESILEPFEQFFK